MKRERKVRDQNQGDMEKRFERVRKAGAERMRQKEKQQEEQKTIHKSRLDAKRKSERE